MLLLLAWLSLLSPSASFARDAEDLQKRCASFPKEFSGRLFASTIDHEKYKAEQLTHHSLLAMKESARRVKDHFENQFCPTVLRFKRRKSDFSRQLPSDCNMLEAELELRIDQAKIFRDHLDAVANAKQRLVDSLFSRQNKGRFNRLENIKDVVLRRKLQREQLKFYGLEAKDTAPVILENSFLWREGDSIAAYVAEKQKTIEDIQLRIDRVKEVLARPPCFTPEADAPESAPKN